jgi:hypothetical protein
MHQQLDALALKLPVVSAGMLPLVQHLAQTLPIAVLHSVR